MSSNAAKGPSRSLLDSEWTLVIKPKQPWWDIDLRELWRYRDLVLLFVRRDFFAQYKQTILGPIWFVAQPILSSVVFTIVFGKIARIPTDGIPSFLFYLSGTVCWGYFSTCLTETSNSFIKNANIFGKVYFPRLVVPISVVISGFLKFLIQFAVFLGFLFYFWTVGASISPSLAIVALPLIVLQMAVLSLGFGILVSSLTTRYRDLALLLGFGVQLWMFFTPVVYPLSQIPDSYRMLVAINPMTSVVECFRLAFIGVSTIGIEHVVLSIAVTLAVFFFGLVLFSRVEKTFMDTI